MEAIQVTLTCARPSNAAYIVKTTPQRSYVSSREAACAVTVVKHSANVIAADRNMRIPRCSYAMDLRRIQPIRPSAEPKSQTAAGTGTTEDEKAVAVPEASLFI